MPGGGRVLTDDRQSVGPWSAADLRGVGDVVQRWCRSAPVQVVEGAVGQFVGAQPGRGREQTEIHPLQAEVAQRHGDRYVVGTYAQQRGQFATHRVPVPLVQDCEHLPYHAAELVVALGGQHQHGRALGEGRGGRRGGLLDDEVGVGASGAERADTGSPYARRSRLPGLGGALQTEGAVVEAQRRVDLVAVQRGDERPVPQLQQHLGHRGDPGGTLQVTDDRLDRTECAGGVHAGVRVAQTLHLDRVAERGPGAVRLDAGDGGGVRSGRRQGAGHHLRLGTRVGDGETTGPAAVVEA
ncbi:hypothetical protein SHIRM173S_02300 [Streptomyces hirsutus]